MKESYHFNFSGIFFNCLRCFFFVISIVVELTRIYLAWANVTQLKLLAMNVDLLRKVISYFLFKWIKFAVVFETYWVDSGLIFNVLFTCLKIELWNLNFRFIHSTQVVKMLSQWKLVEEKNLS